jgi:hypothetical protein
MEQYTSASALRTDFASGPVSSPSFSKPTVAAMASRRMVLPVSTSPDSGPSFEMDSK